MVADREDEPKVSESTLIRLFIFILGIGLLLLSVTNLWVTQQPRSVVTEAISESTVLNNSQPSVLVEESDPTEVTGANPDPSLSGTQEGDGLVTSRTAPGKRTTTTTQGRTRTITQPSTRTVTTKEPTRSDTLRIALLGLGVTLLFLGALYPRMEGFTLPGGAGIQLKKLADGTVKVDARVATLEDVTGRLVPKLEVLLQEAQRRSKESRDGRQ
jgi:hypothetical protein